MRHSAVIRARSRRSETAAVRAGHPATPRCKPLCQVNGNSSAVRDRLSRLTSLGSRGPAPVDVVPLATQKPSPPSLRCGTHRTEELL